MPTSGCATASVRGCLSDAYGTALSLVPRRTLGSRRGVLSTFQQVAFSMGVTVIAASSPPLPSARSLTRAALGAAFCSTSVRLALTFSCRSGCRDGSAEEAGGRSRRRGGDPSRGVVFLQASSSRHSRRRDPAPAPSRGCRVNTLLQLQTLVVAESDVLDYEGN